MKDEVMTNIVSLLESDETFAEIVEKILREAERYLCTSHAAVLQVSTVSGHRGDEVSVTVSLTSNPGIAGLVFSLTFDNKVLKLVDVKEPANTDDEFIKLVAKY